VTPQVVNDLVELSGIEPLASSLRKRSATNFQQLTQQNKALLSGKQRVKILNGPKLAPDWPQFV
jgi:hypothetical protein